MVLIDVHKKNQKQRRRACKQSRELHQLAIDKSLSDAQDDPTSSSSGPGIDPPSQQHTSAPAILDRQNSFTDQDDILPPVSLLSHQRSFIYDDFIDLNMHPDLTIYSEEGIDDMDLPDNILFDDLDFLDNITSCNKVENCLMLSEYEQNLIKETEGGPVISTATNLRRMGRKWSLLRQPTLQTIHSESEDVSTTKVELENQSMKQQQPRKQHSSLLFTLGVLKEHAGSKEDAD